jgi:glycosyltransferase involved in cell wall biosynthesis
MVVHAYYLKDARVRRYAELLAARGIEVDVLCLRERDEPKETDHLGVNIYRIGLGRIRSGKLSYVYEYLASFFLFLIKLNQLYFSGRRYDVLHVHNMPDMLVFCGFLQKLFGVKIVLDLHDLMSEVYQSKYNLEHNHWLPILLRFQERMATWFASSVITANHAFADILFARGVPPAKLTVVMNAPNSNFFLTDAVRTRSRAGKRSDDFHAIYIGTLAPRYGVEIAVRALSKLLSERRIPGLRFSIIPKISNEGTYAEDVLAEIRRSPLADVFQLMKPVSHDSMPAMIAEADVMMYTPIPDVHMDIALSLKIPEAIGVGCPIVASRLEVHERYFGDESLFMFEPGDIDGCARRVLEVYCGGDTVKRKVDRAKQKLGEISWERQSAEYLALLSRLAPAGAGALSAVR